MTLRCALFIFAIGLIVVGLLPLLDGQALIGPTVWGAILLVALLIERWRYVAPTELTTASQGWQLTDEKFVDPETGTVMQVAYHAESGARRYVPIAPATSPGRSTINPP